MRILITGIHGFVGPYLKKELVSQGNDVFGIDRKGTDECIACNLLHASEVQEAFKKLEPDVVVHLAALTSVKQSWDDPEGFMRTNLEMTRNVLEAITAMAKKPQMLLTSSSDVYGSQSEFPITEQAVPRPANPYAKSKFAQEQLLKEYPAVSSTITRAFNHTGPGQGDALAVSSFAKQVALCEKGKQEFLRVGNLEAYRDYSDVHDVVRAYGLIIKHNLWGELFNVCSGKKIQMKKILEMLLSFSSKEIDVREDPERLRPSDVPEFWGSYEKINEATGWAPKIPLHNTLKEIFYYWKDNT